LSEPVADDAVSRAMEERDERFLDGFVYISGRGTRIQVRAHIGITGQDGVLAASALAAIERAHRRPDPGTAFTLQLPDHSQVRCCLITSEGEFQIKR
jgi:hypothetical protein